MEFVLDGLGLIIMLKKRRTQITQIKQIVTDFISVLIGLIRVIRVPKKNFQIYLFIFFPSLILRLGAPVVQNDSWYPLVVMGK